jgi:hypothetical protein
LISSGFAPDELLTILITLASPGTGFYFQREKMDFTEVYPA